MQFLAFALIYPLLWGLSKLPFKGIYVISDIAYTILYHGIGYRKKTVQKNLKLAFPEYTAVKLKTIEKQFYHHLCDLFLEMIKSISISEKQLRQRMVFTNPDVMRQFEDRDQNAIIIMGHYASYEWLTAFQLDLKNPSFGVYKRVKNPYFDRMVHRIRSRWNTTMLANKIVRREMQRYIDSGRIANYAFIADQSPRRARGQQWFSFLDMQLPFFTGVERIARDFNLPVVHLNVQKLKRGHYEGTFQILTETPQDMEEHGIISAFAKALEKQIREAPQYYLWTHERFKHLGKDKI